MKQSTTKLRSGIARIVPLIALFSVLSGPAIAQTVTGSIYGTVADPTGAVIPNSTVIVKNAQTGETHSVQTNGVGNYTFPALEPGEYTVSAQGAGFQTEQQEHVRLDVSQNVDVSFKLPPGSQEQMVTVSAAATLVDTLESQLGETVDQKRIQELPLNGRNAYSLVQIVPGVTNFTAAAAGGDSSGATFQVNGSRSNDDSFYLDGVFDSTIYRNGGSELPNPDALAEFRLLTSNFDAEFGREPGGVVNTITRSGSNAYHGTLYEYLRNNVLNAANYFISGVTPLKQNQFGGSFGGPIIRDKAFYFGSYEGFRVRTPAYIASASLVTPTPAEAQGNFSAVPASQQPKMSNGQTYSCNNVVGVICSNLIDPVAKTLLTYVPLANPATGVTPEQSAPANVDENQYLARVDDQLTEKQKISAMFFTSHANTQDPNQGSNQVFDFTQASHYDNQTNAALSHIWTISPTKLNSLRLFYSLNHYQVNSVYDTTWSNYGSQVGLAGPLARQPLLTITGYWAMGLGGQGPQDLSMQQLGAMDTFNWTHGNHTVKGGGSFIWNKYAETGVFLESGKASFSGYATGNALADFLLGHANTFEQNSGAYHRTHVIDPALFAQDDWRILHRLTLNLGMRWEMYPPFTGQRNLGTFVPNVQSTRFPAAPLGLLSVGDKGIPDGIRHMSWKDFGPRVGFAYDVFGNGRTALRGAFGIFYSEEEETLDGNLEQQPFTLDVLVNHTPNLVTPYAPSADPFPYNISSPQFTSGATIAGLPPNDSSVPYAQEYNLTLQQQLGSDWSLQLAYVGSVTRKFYLMRDQNAPVFSPGASTSTAGLNARRPYEPTPSTYVFGEITELDPASNSSYNSMQVTVTRRMSHGLSVLASYVWARDIQFVSADPSTAPTLVNENDIGMDKGLSDTAVPQRFVASYLWALPTIQSWGVVGRRILSGWQINGITSLQSGEPFTVTSGKDTNLDGINNDRPNQVGNPQLPGGRSRSQQIHEYFNTAAFAQLPSGVPYGNVHRASLLGPKFVNTDLSAFRTIPIWHEETLQLRGEIFNLFNNVNLNNPNGIMTSNQFGTIPGSGTPRIVQFALRYSF
jgi:hypothetical protein